MCDSQVVGRGSHNRVSEISGPQLAKAELRRVEESVARAVGSKTDLDKAKATLDVNKAQLTKREAVSTAANIQYAWPHPSKRWLYVVSSSGGPAAGDVSGSVHVANAFAIDPVTGALFFDADGTGAAAQVEFATVLPGLALTQSAFVVI